MVGCDVVGPMPATTKGKKYLLVAVDYLNRWPVALDVQAIDMITTADFLFMQLMRQHGLPQYVLKDRCSNFTSSYVEDFLRAMQVKYWTPRPTDHKLMAYAKG